jgi:hypothetical protein
MFTWWKLYNSVPYETVVRGLDVDTKGPTPEFCDGERSGRTGEQERDEQQEAKNGS